MILKDKSWPANVDLYGECEAMIGDLYLHYHYLKLPVYLNAVIYRSRNIFANLGVGLSINLTLKSTSNGEDFRTKYDFCDYDYQRVEAERNPRYPAEIIVGTSFFYKNVGLDLLYSYTLGKTEFLYGLSIHDKIHSIQMMFSWRLKKANKF